jgi:hypothetical protein
MILFSCRKPDIKCYLSAVNKREILGCYLHLILTQNSGKKVVQPNISTLRANANLENIDYNEEIDVVKVSQFINPV